MTDDAAPPAESTPEAAPPAAPPEPIAETPEPPPEPLVEPVLPESQPVSETLATPDATPEPILVEEVAPTPVTESPDVPTEPSTQIASEKIPEPQPRSNTQPSIEPRIGLAARKERREEAFAKILEHARGKEFITNDMVQKLLRCSNATAVRYLSALVLRGKLWREGKGRGVKYKIV
ncbi:MAG: hypothetical protein WA021_05130 [Minisyncoccia bacterium]